MAEALKDIHFNFEDGSSCFVKLKCLEIARNFIFVEEIGTLSTFRTFYHSSELWGVIIIWMVILDEKLQNNHFLGITTEF